MTVWARELWRRSGLSARAVWLVVVIYGVAAVSIVAWSLLGWEDSPFYGARPIDHVALLLGLLFVAACAARAARRAAGRRRCGWLSLVVAVSAWAFAECVWIGVEARGGTEPAFPSPADVVLLLFPFGAFASLLMLSEGTGAHRWRLALDGVIVATSLFVVSWVFVLDRMVRDGGNRGLVTVLHTVIDVVLMTTAILVWSRDRPGGRVSLSLAVSGILTIGIADVVTIYTIGVGGYHTGDLVDIARLAGLALLSLAALSSAAEPPIETSLFASESRARLWLPYAPLMLAGVAGMTYAIRTMGIGPLIAAEGLLVCAVLLRQFVVLVQNQRLLSDVSKEAFHDRLTGLPNRSHFLDTLEGALRRRNEDSPPIAVLCLDLDNFKTVNDELGHPAGDELLIRVAGRLTRCLGDTFTVARLGGDEFAALIEGPVEDSLAAADRALDAFTTPIVIDGVPLSVRPSIGLTVSTDGSSRTVDDFLLHADLAMYAAKRDGGGCVRSFVPDMPFPYELPQLADHPSRQANSTETIKKSAAERSVDRSTRSTRSASPLEHAKDLPVSFRRPPLAIWLALAALAIGVAVFAASTVLRASPGRNVLFDSVLYPTLTLSGAALIVLRAYRVTAERWAWLLIAAGMASSAIGDVVYALWVSDDQVPSVADPWYLAFYPLLYGGLMLLMRARLKRVVPTLRLDAVVCGLTMAAVAAALVAGPIHAAMSGSPATVMVGLAYPAGDMLLLAISVGALAMLGWRTEWRWVLLVAGFVLYVIADTVYLFQTSAGTYEEGTWLDAFWPLASLIVAMASWQPSSTLTPRLRTGLGSYITPVVCTLVALVISVVANHDRLAVALAASSLVAVAARFAVSFRDVSAVADNYRHAMTDELTGLPNRRSLATTLTGMSVDEPSRRPRSRCGLILLDLDQFGEINDLADRAVGDEVMRRIADRLTQAVRGEHLVARTADDEFAVLMEDVDLTTARAQAGALLEVMSEPFALEQITLQVDATAAIALCPNHCDHPVELLNRVETTMAHSKKSRSKIAVYDPADHVTEEDSTELVQELRTALSDGQLTCYYQPKVSTADGSVHSVEALLRWNHPIRGILLPEVFLPAAEQAGLMRQVANYVVDLALAQIRLWRDDGIELTVAVNLSTSNLLDLDLVETIERLLDAHELPPDALILEITESTLATDSVRSRNTVAALRRLGVRISLDDFGTGWSSLARLQDLSVDELKLDKVFVSRLALDPRSIAIVRSTVALAHSLGANLVAEGVEDVTTLRALQRYGCTITQGYVHSPPLPAGQLRRWLARYSPNGEAWRYEEAAVTD